MACCVIVPRVCDVVLLLRDIVFYIWRDMNVFRCRVVCLAPKVSRQGVEGGRSTGLLISISSCAPSQRVQDVVRTSRQTSRFTSTVRPVSRFCGSMYAEERGLGPAATCVLRMAFHVLFDGFDIASQFLRRRVYSEIVKNMYAKRC